MNDLDDTPRPVAEITHEASAFEQFLDKNQKKLILFSVFLILLAAAIVVYKNKLSDKENAASAALIDCYNEETFKYDPAKLEALQKQYAGTKAATSATYLHTLSLWDAGRLEDSIKELERFISSYPTSDLRNQAALVLASRHWQQENLSKAQEVYQLVVDACHPVYSPVALLSLGDMAREKGDVETAKKLYQEVLSQYPDSSFAFLAPLPNMTGNELRKSAIQDRLDLLGIKPPTVISAPLELPKFDTNIIPAEEKK